MDMLTRVFCEVDDFCQAFEPEFNRMLLTMDLKPSKTSRMSLSEIMTIVIHFHQSNYRCFKHFYIKHVLAYLKAGFPQALSYNRVVELMPSALILLCAFMKSKHGKPTGISYVDATKLQVCHNKRIPSNRVFDGFASRGKTSMGWFYGFKLHLVVNDRGEILAVKCTTGKAHDVSLLDSLCARLWGKLFGDKGYISKEKADLLMEKYGIELITTRRKNMKKKKIPLFDLVLLRGRSIIETINDQLKNISQIEHSRHRSFYNFMVNLVSGIIAYTFQEKKPSLNIQHSGLVVLNA
jgi:hypothetical protein